MSKKKFSEGLDDLFKDIQDVDTPHFGGDQPGIAVSDSPRRSGSKNFLSDIDAIIQEALDESMDKYEQTQSAETLSGKNKSRESALRPSLGGLDSLIRQTIDIQEMREDEQSGKKRLTVAVEKYKLEKLKTIARLENTYLKNILVELIDEYISEYRKEHGIDL